MKNLQKLPPKQYQDLKKMRSLFRRGKISFSEYHVYLYRYYR